MLSGRDDIFHTLLGRWGTILPVIAAVITTMIHRVDGCLVIGVVDGAFLIHSILLLSRLSDR